MLGIAAIFLAIDLTKTDVSVLILSDANLVDVRSPLSDLQVLYNGKDLIREHLNLHLYRIQVQNTGNNIILKDQFDENDLWGVHVSFGTIVKIGEPASDSTYIRKNVLIKTPDQMTLRFTPIIFEPGDFFILDFFVLLSTSEPPSITSVGKIAGIKEIPVRISNLNKKSLVYEAYGGDWEILLLRVLAAPVYILLFIACIVGVVWPAILRDHD